MNLLLAKMWWFSFWGRAVLWVVATYLLLDFLYYTDIGIRFM